MHAPHLLASIMMLVAAASDSMEPEAESVSDDEGDEDTDPDDGAQDSVRATAATLFRLSALPLLLLLVLLPLLLLLLLLQMLQLILMPLLPLLPLLSPSGWGIDAWDSLSPRDHDSEPYALAMQGPIVDADEDAQDTVLPPSGLQAGEALLYNSYSLGTAPSAAGASAGSGSWFLATLSRTLDG
jgi:hypothetical protein